MPGKVRDRTARSQAAELKQQIVESEQVCGKGKRWYEERKHEFETANLGRYIVIDSETGEYVIAETRLDVMLLADSKFKTKYPRYITRIGLPDTLILPRTR